MKRLKLLSATALVFLAAKGFAGLPGENYCNVKGKAEAIKSAKKIAFLSFNTNTVITGSSGMGSLVSGALAAAKGNESKKMTLDQAYIDKNYELFENVFKSEGYEVVPVKDVLASKAYQAATESKMPTTINAKGLKSVNWKKTDSLKAIAAELGAERVITVDGSHGMWSKFSALGNTAGKVAGQAGVMMLIFDEQGKRVLMVDAKQTSDTVNQQVGGGFQDPTKIMPMLQEADKKLASEIGAKLSKK